MQILWVEDDKYLRADMAGELASYGKVSEVGGVAQALELLEKNDYRVALVDLGLAEKARCLGGLRVLEKCREKGILSIVLSAHKSKDIIARAYGMGCDYYFTKEDIRTSLHKRIGGILKNLDGHYFGRMFKKDFITINPRLIDHLKDACDHFVNGQNILLTGPTGVGKTKIAKWIHTLCYSETPFVHLNLAELPDNLIESELFGHRKGAFTGALTDRSGLLEKASGGTLFLDEIGTISLGLQKKLLKAVDEKVFYPVGSTSPKRVNFRLISATCDDLATLMQEKRFRADFYFRIKGTQIRIPALKERREDIIPLVDHFIQSSPQKMALTSDAENRLLQYDWFGNIRELKNLVLELIQKSQGFISSEDLPFHIVENKNPTKRQKTGGLLTKKMIRIIDNKGFPALIKKIEEEALRTYLCQSDQQVNQTIKALGISKSLFYRIKSGIDEKLGEKRGP